MLPALCHCVYHALFFPGATVKMNGVSAQVSAESGAYVKEQDEPTRVVSKSDEQKSRIKVAIKVCFRCTHVFLLFTSAPALHVKLQVSAGALSHLTFVLCLCVRSLAPRLLIVLSAQSCVLFSETDPEDIERIVDAMDEKKVLSQEVVITEGQEGDYFYVIESGNYTASKGGQSVFTYEGKGSFGELALMYNCPRAATVTADTDGVIWALDRMTFRKVRGCSPNSSHPALVQRCASLIASQMCTRNKYIHPTSAFSLVDKRCSHA